MTRSRDGALRLASTAAPRRVEIMRTAAEVFRRRGYHGASVEQIAGALNMTKGNLYYYFKNKEEILFTCHDYALDVIQEHLEHIRRSPLPIDQKVHAVIRGFVLLFTDVLHGTAWTLELEALSPALLKRIVARRDKVDRAFRQLLREGMTEGVFGRRDATLATFAVMGAINWVPLWFKPSGRVRAEEIATAFADLLVGGLTASAGLSAVDVGVGTARPVRVGRRPR